MLRTAVLAGFLLLPTVAFASCLPNSTTVVYINGINTTQQDALNDLHSLEQDYKFENHNSDVQFLNGYNQTYGGGLDVWRLTSQMLAWNPKTWNEDMSGDMLLWQLHNDLTTQKVVLAGYSQGSMYANETYKYLATHGLSTASVANFDVGTPASYVAGGGTHLTSTNDTEIAEARRLAENVGLAKPLPANITIPLFPEDDTGHQFATSYLAGAADQIVNTLQWDIQNLAPTTNDDMESCFTPPSSAFLHKVAVGVNTTGTSLGTLAYLGGASAYIGTVAAVNSAFGAVGKVASDIGVFAGGLNGLAHSAQPQYQPTNYNIVDHLYGGHNQTVDGQSLQDLLGNNQGGAVTLATVHQAEQPVPPADSAPVQDGPNASAPGQTGVPAPQLVPVEPGFGGGGGSGEVSQTETPAVEDTVSDDTASTTDVDEASTTPDTSAPALFDASTQTPVLTVEECTYSLSSSFCLTPSTRAHLSWSDIGADHYNVLVNGVVVANSTGTSTAVVLGDQASSSIQIVAYDASTTPQTLSSNTSRVYVYERPVIINEVAWGGTTNSPEDQWVELYNRTPFEIALSPLTLSGDTWSLKLSKSIPLNTRYFTVMSHDGVIHGATDASAYFLSGLASITTPQQLTLAYATPSATTTIDTTPAAAACGGAWCAGLASVDHGFAGARSGAPVPVSMERVSADSSGSETSNWAGSDGYTLNAQDANEQWIVGTPNYANTQHWPMIGFFCNGDTGILTSTSGSTYRPASSACTYLAGFSSGNDIARGVLFKGTVGSSTQVTSALTGGTLVKALTDNHADLSSAASGDSYFVALISYNTGIGTGNVQLLPDLLSYLKTGVQTDGTTTSAPDLTYYTLPFVIP